MTTNTRNTATDYIDLPTADDLDSGGIKDSSWICKLYLIPAEEGKSGRPAVTAFVSVGNVGTPMPAFNRRWLSLGWFGPQIVGESVLDQLEKAAGRLADLAERYRGTEWDGNNNIGRWDIDDNELMALDDIPDREQLRCYWDASDWFTPAGVQWEELCEEAGVDPTGALSDDWEDLADEVAATVEPLQDEPVSGTAAYARYQAEDYRREHHLLDAYVGKNKA